MPPPNPFSGGTRPSNSELVKKVTDALAAVQAGHRYLGVTKHLTDDFVALGISSEAELWQELPQLIEEIKSADPVSCYCGGHPPYRSYDQEMKNMELWPYRWQSKKLGKMMYLKFAVKADKRGNWNYVHVDVHEDRPNKKSVL